MLRHQLLYIEDDAEIAQLCCDALSVHGYDVTVATTGMSGLREFENSDFELVLMDVGLPDISGIEAGELLRSKSPDTPILFITIADDEKSKSDALAVGSAGYIVKGSLDVYTKVLPQQLHSIFDRIERDKNTQGALLESDARFRAIYETAASAIITITGTGLIDTLNPATERLFGYEESELVGQNINILMPEPDRSRHDGYLSNYLSSGLSKIIGIGREVTGCHKNGRQFPLHLSISEFTSGGKIYFTGILSDLSEQKTLEAEIIQSRDRYRSLFENSQAGIIRSRIDSGRILETNERAAQIFGYADRGEMIENFIAADHYADPVHRDHMLAQLKEHGRLDSVEIEYRTKDGATIWIRSSLSAHFEENYLDAVLIDVTDTFKFNHAQKISEERFKDFSAAAADRFWELDQNNVITFISPPTETLRAPSENLIGGDLLKVLPNNWFVGNHERLTQALKSKSTFRNIRYSQEKPDGTKFQFSLSGLPVFDSAGGFLGFRGATRDITREIEAEEAATTMQKRFFNAMENLDLGFALWDADERFVFCNSYFKQLHLGFDSLRLLKTGTNFEELIRNYAHDGRIGINAAEQEDWIKARVEMFRKGQFDTEITRDDGRVISSTSQILDDGSAVLFRLDITESKQQQLSAEAANRAKSEFLSSMSHELRTPLNAILGFGQLMSCNPKDPPTDGQKEYIGHIISGGEHLLSLINDVLELSKIEVGKVSLSIENVAPGPLLQECLTTVASKADEAEIDLIDETMGVDLPNLWTDRNRLRQIVINLLSNAVKYNKPGGRIILSTKTLTVDMLRVEVADTGFGIPADKQTHLFEPFNRLGRENETIEGTGIGLTITKQLVELLSGNIGFRSEDGAGSNFWVDIPLSKMSDKQLGSTDPVAQQSTPIAPKTDGRRKLLYVEDNPPNLNLMAALIEQTPLLELVSADTAELAMDLIRESKPDLILMDINLPGMSGIEALAKLKSLAETVDIPVIALTAAAMPHQIKHGLDAGFADYVTKPINISQILETISAHLK
ncbi:MAG: PAS domain S-box protein [Rhodospirillales bacterium]|nr:PAS domain S-box protein [Rhodospirillales bacterium]